MVCWTAGRNWKNDAFVFTDGIQLQFQFQFSINVSLWNIYRTLKWIVCLHSKDFTLAITPTLTKNTNNYKTAGVCGQGMTTQAHNVSNEGSVLKQNNKLSRLSVQ